MRIRDIIEQQGISTKQLADKMGISQSALNQNISGNPSVKVLTSIASALDVPLWQLFISPEEMSGNNGSTVRCPNCGAEFEIELKAKEK